jgi:hypothetical protein
MKDHYEVVDVKRAEGSSKYTIQRIDNHGITFTFIVRMFDNGMFGLRSIHDKQLGYSSEMRDEAIKAINHYKLISGLEGGAKDTWSDILS